MFEFCTYRKRSSAEHTHTHVIFYKIFCLMHTFLYHIAVVFGWLNYEMHTQDAKI